MWYIDFYLFLAGIGQIVYPYTGIGKGECAHYLRGVYIQLVAITLTQQLLGVPKTIIGKEIIEILVST